VLLKLDSIAQLHTSYWYRGVIIQSFIMTFTCSCVTSCGSSFYWRSSYFRKRSKLNSSNFLLLWTVLVSFLTGFCLSYLRPRCLKATRKGVFVTPFSSSVIQTGDTVEPTSSTGTNSSPYGGGFYDEAIIYVRAGSGGQGASTYARISSNGSGKTLGKPNGGQGGNGGSVILHVDSSLNTLAHLNYASYRPNSYGGAAMSERKNSNSNHRWIRSFRAENGADGKSGFKNGRWADDMTIYVPSGTIVQEITMDDVGQDTKEEVVGGVGETVELSVANNLTSVVLAKGGTGGDGSAVATKRRSSPQGGERKHFKLTLKIVGDVAIVGLPNAGKSTLLASVTRAKPRIANYPFTTVIPNLGVWISEDHNDDHRQHSGYNGKAPSTLVLCDVPGLISGAADGVGLGHAFLRHVERCHVLLHIVDATSDDPLRDFEVINQELTRYGNGCLVHKPQVVVVNKCDVWDQKKDTGSDASTSSAHTSPCKLSKHELEQGLLKKMPHSRLLFISASKKEGVEDLMHRLSIFTGKVKAASKSASPVTE
jgi:GTP-binding protein